MIETLPLENLTVRVSDAGVGGAEMLAWLREIARVTRKLADAENARASAPCPSEGKGPATPALPQADIDLLYDVYNAMPAGPLRLRLVVVLQRLTGELATAHNAKEPLASNPMALTNNDVVLLSRAYACMPAGSDKKEFQALVERLTGAAL